MNTRKLQYQVVVTLIFGILAFLIRALNLITPLGDVFVLDLRDFFVAIGAAIGGPISGLVIGILAGLPAHIPLIDISSFAIAGLSVGIFSIYFHRKKIPLGYSAIFMLCGYFVAFLFIIFLGLWKNLPFLIARAVISTPVNIFILNNLFRTYPRIPAIARFS